MGYDQTACLVAVVQFVAEDHSRGYRKYRNLTKERNQPIRTKATTQKASKTQPIGMKLIQNIDICSINT